MTQRKLPEERARSITISLSADTYQQLLDLIRLDETSTSGTIANCIRFRSLNSPVVVLEEHA